jgi:large subunit ribosomal protein L4
MKAVGEIDLADALFARPVRVDLLARAVNYQRNKARQGTHSTKIISQIRGTTAKPYKQKGTGNARQGSLRSPQFRGGAVIFGPTPRSHETGLQKKVRKAALATALSAKQAEGKLVVLDAIKTDKIKTKTMAAKLAKIGSSILFIDGANVDVNFNLSVRNIPHVSVLPEGGANVYDILRHDTLVLTTAGVEQLTARLNKVKAAKARTDKAAEKSAKAAKPAAAAKKPAAKKTAAKKAE